MDRQVIVSFDVIFDGLVRLDPATFNVSAGDKHHEWNIDIMALSPGSFIISANITPNVTECV